MTSRFKFRLWCKFDSGKYGMLDHDNLAQRAVEDLFEIEEGDALMQSTGLLDKNGKEIFQGDIVKVELPDDHKAMLGVVTWDEEGADYEIRGKPEGLDTEFYCALGLKWSIYEVLGNLYESPELLNKQNNE